MSDSRRFWMGFNLVKGIGAARLQMLLSHFGDVETAWTASSSALQAAGLSQKLVERFVQVRNSVNLNQLLADTLAGGIKVITWEDSEYPVLLKEIDQPPPVLYVRGELAQEDIWSVAIVGTRRVSPYGRQVTEEIASYLAANDVSVVSGLARGVDAIAHAAAIKSGGRSLAVLGSGVDRIYPPENRQLAEKMMARGAIISDYPPGTPPEGTNFPPRNRIISGLSRAVVVIEAGETSGALITADFAAGQGREVFAVPGNILAPQSKGTNKLIRSGAHPLLNPRDVLDTLDMAHAGQQRKAREILPTDPIEAKLLEAIGHDPTHVDEIRNQTGLPIEKVSSALTMMELKGLVRQVGGMHYVTVREVQSGYSPEQSN